MIRPRVSKINSSYRDQYGSRGRQWELYGAVTNSTIAEELRKLSFRSTGAGSKLGWVIKSAGKFNAVVSLYEGEEAHIKTGGWPAHTAKPSGNRNEV